MTPNLRKVALIAAVLGLLLSLFIALRRDDDLEERPVLEFELREGAPVGGVQRATVKRGARVSIRIVSDTAGELHIHGYDITSPIESTGTQEVAFAADKTGVFELEFEGSHTLLGELTVEA